jgi:hypothetical protein
MANLEYQNNAEELDLEEAKKMKMMKKKEEEEEMEEGTMGHFPNPRGDKAMPLDKKSVSKMKNMADMEEEAEEEEEEESGKKKMMMMKKKKMSEETLAATTIRTHKTADAPMDDPKAISASKIGMMTSMMGMMSTMHKDDMTSFFDKVQALYHKGKDWGIGNESGHNKDSISTTLGKGNMTPEPMPKLDSKNHWLEDVQAIFQGEDLTEEFRDNVATIFGAAVEARVIAESVRLEEAYEAKLNEELAIFSEEVTSKLDTYLDYVVEQWMKENEVAVESTLRNELAEEFVEGLKSLFAEHYINVPEDKVDVLEVMAEKVAALEEKMDEVISENVELKNFALEVQKEEIFEEVASDLALTQREKFGALAEGIEFDGDLETYGKKLMIVKENYFRGETSTRSSNIEEETFEGDVTETKNVDPRVNAYASVLSRTLKK